MGNTLLKLVRLGGSLDFSSSTGSSSDTNQIFINKVPLLFASSKETALDILIDLFSVPGCAIQVKITY